MMAETAHAIIFAYPALTGLLVALAALAVILRASTWWENRKALRSPIEGLHGDIDNLEVRARRML